MPPPPELGPRDVLGPYRLQSVLRRGQAGDTYRAIEIADDRPVALLLLATDSSDREYAARVDQACRIVARLRSPYVVRVHDHGESNGRLYVAMGLVEGPDLTTVLNTEGALAPEQAVSVVEQLGAALQAAHARGLVHGDLKPANVLFEAGGDEDRIDRAGLMGFGLVPPNRLSLDYVSPERIRGLTVDHRQDVYALGGVLFACLTGSKPFRGSSPPERMRAHLESPVPRPSQRLPGLSQSFDDVVMRAMAKTANDRWSTVGGLVRAARAALWT